jgi:C_GCAxxG_C_C family probable redox protein
METPETNAATLFAEGFNCAQSVFASHARQFDLESETALKLSSAFGAGMGRKGEVCGAVTGALMVIGLACGPSLASDKETKERTYQLTSRFIDEFVKKNSSSLCRELLGFRIDHPEELEKARQAGVFASVCPRVVKEASEILDQLLAEEKLSGDCN